MSRILEVVTPEQVSIRYELAGFGSRSLAAMVDYSLQLLFYLVVGVIFFLAKFAMFTDPVQRSSFFEKMSSSIFAGLVILIMFLIAWGYFIAFETLWNGLTPGKRLLGLRVIRDGGLPVDFRSVAIRNLLRAIDMLPGLPIIPTYAAGFVCVLCHHQYKRLGDIAAGTLVVKHGRDEEESTAFNFGETVMYRLLDATILSQISRLTREEYRIIKRFLDRRNDLPQPLRAEFARRLALPLIEKFSYQLPSMGIDYERWLDELDLAYRSRALGQSAAPPAPDIPSPTQSPAAAVETRKW